MRVAVLGAGNAGLAMAGHLSLLGHEVRLYNRSPERLSAVQRQGGIQVEGIVSGFAPVACASSDLAPTTEGASLIMVTTSAVGHRFIAEGVAPYLRDNQVIVLNPGRTFGALEFSSILDRERVRSRVVLAETQTFLHTSRITEPGAVSIYATKNAVGVAAFPAADTNRVVDCLAEAYPQVFALSSIAESGLNNIGAVFHPTPTLLNMSRILAREPFLYYHQGISREVSRVLEEIDRERVALGQCLGVHVLTAVEWLKSTYGSTGQDLYEAVQNTDAYREVPSPSSLDHRYLQEDVPTGLVPLASLGEFLGIATPGMRSIINLASIVTGIDFWQVGRTMASLGLAGLDKEALLGYLLSGAKPSRVTLR